MKYYIIAGEASGDLHGKNLIAAIRRADTDAQFRFWGGDKMAKEAGVEPVKHYRETAIMGIIEVVLNLKKVLGFLKLCKRDIAAWQPDAVVLIDYPGFNLKIAQWAHKRGFNTFYYIAPKVWAWREGRVKRLRACVDKLFVIFPFEVEWFAARGIEVSYVGNPLLDEIVEREVVARPERPIIALVAGSRKIEIDHNLRTMVEVMGRFAQYDGVVTGVDWLSESLYDKYIKDAPNVRVVYGQTYQTLAAASGALVTSGTATLEAALLNVPEVVCYRGPAITMAIARVLIGSKVKWISLVNLIMGRQVVRELVGDRSFSVDNCVEALGAVLPGGESYDQMMDDFGQLRLTLGSSGASARCAEQIVEMTRKFCDNR